MTAPAAPAASPPARPAPARVRVLTQARFEVGTLLRNGEQLLVALVLPALALVALVLAHTPSLGPGRRVDVTVPGVMALAIVSTAFTGQAIATGFDRRYGVLRLLGLSPLGRTGLLLAKAVAVLAVELLQIVVVAVLGLALGWRPRPAGFVAALPAALLGTWAFVALALLLAGVLRAEGVLAVANLAWVLLLGLGGLLVPTGQLPAALAEVARWLPSGALADALRAAFLHGRAAGIPLLVLAGWGAGATALTARTFRWGD